MGQNVKDLMNEIAASGLRLADITHIRAGGKPGLVLAPRTPQDVAGLLPALKEAGREYAFVGGGSNLLFRDGSDTVLIIDRNMVLDLEIEGDLVTPSSAWNLNRLMMVLAKQDLGGLEFLAGIPAHLGGAIRTNAGALNYEMSAYTEAVELIDEKGEMKRISGDQVVFGYRHSDLSGYISRVTLRLVNKPRAAILKTIRDNIGRRRLTQPLNYPNLGCFFKNPNGYAAGWLIDRCGLKGVRVGGAMVSPKHANFIINTGNATPKDILDLAELVQVTVQQKEGIRLEMEVQVV